MGTIPFTIASFYTNNNLHYCYNYTNTNGFFNSTSKAITRSQEQHQEHQQRPRRRTQQQPQSLLMLVLLSSSLSSSRRQLVVLLLQLLVFLSSSSSNMITISFSLNSIIRTTTTTTTNAVTKNTRTTLSKVKCMKDCDIQYYYYSQRMRRSHCSSSSSSSSRSCLQASTSNTNDNNYDKNNNNNRDRIIILTTATQQQQQQQQQQQRSDTVIKSYIRQSLIPRMERIRTITTTMTTPSIDDTILLSPPEELTTLINNTNCTTTTNNNNTNDLYQEHLNISGLVQDVVLLLLLDDTFQSHFGTTGRTTTSTTTTTGTTSRMDPSIINTILQDIVSEKIWNVQKSTTTSNHDTTNFFDEITTSNSYRNRTTLTSDRYNVGIIQDVLESIIQSNIATGTTTPSSNNTNDNNTTSNSNSNNTNMDAKAGTTTINTAIPLDPSKINTFIVQDLLSERIIPTILSTTTNTNFDDETVATSTERSIVDDRSKITTILQEIVEQKFVIPNSDTYMVQNTNNEQYDNNENNDDNDESYINQQQRRRATAIPTTSGQVVTTLLASLLQDRIGQQQQQHQQQQRTITTTSDKAATEIKSRKAIDADIIVSKDDDFENDESNNNNNNTKNDSTPISYGSNPTITLTAMGPLLWQSILVPNQDIAIDATAGNGNDSIAIAQLLFPPTIIDDTSSNAISNAKLICIDIQKEACDNTKERLEAIIPSSILQNKNNIQIINQSHESLVPLVGGGGKFLSSVGLVVYNLGYLPGSDRRTSGTVTTTTTQTTIRSLQDAAILLRIGGMISVMTYPKTNPEEAFAVQIFFVGLALFSSKTQSWERYLDNMIEQSQQQQQTIPCSVETVLAIQESLLYVHRYNNGPSKQQQQQTWRVHEHKKLGWLDAPILLTATRIK